ncbi:MAG: Uma2 family endonuclease [Pseudomonadota bacterium]
MEDGFISYHTRPDGERYFTNADMARMVARGLIDPEDRWELIRGAWFDMGSEGFEHMTARTRIVRTVIEQMVGRNDVEISTEASIFLSHDTEVRPDVVIYRADVSSNEMTGDDMSLVIEIMKTSQRRDRELKLPVYAAAGVPEVWLVDLDGKTVEVCRAPDTAAAAYAKTATAAFTEALSPGAFPSVSLRVSDLL